MVRLMPIHTGDHFGSTPLMAVGLFICVSALVALCANHARRLSKKQGPESKDSKLVPQSPLWLPRQLMATISNKATPLIHHQKTKVQNEAEIGSDKAEEGFGEGGLWQKKILMGEKCQPPEFSGVIYYDYRGNRISELPPRSPRASPLPNCAYLVTRDTK